MGIVEEDGGLKPLTNSGPSLSRIPSIRPWKLPYFSELSKIREIIEKIYCTKGLCDRESYAIWRNMLYSSGWVWILVGPFRLLLDIEELDQFDRYLRDLVFETPNKDRIPLASAMGISLNRQRLMVELLPIFADGSSINDDPVLKRQKNQIQWLTPNRSVGHKTTTSQSLSNRR